MRTLSFALLALCSATFTVASCGSDSSPATPQADASTPAHDAGDEQTLVPQPDAMVAHCTLSNGGDPVSLCLQKRILKTERQAAFIKALGVAQSWDSKTFLPDTANGQTLHDLHDDVAFASSIVDYDFASGKYGDTEINTDLDNVLVTMVTNIENEVTTPPAEYRGDFYKQLRNVAGGLRNINENTHADKIDALADVYGRLIYSSFYQPIGGSDAVLGTMSSGNVAYTTADVASGALALLQLAERHKADDATNAGKWVAAAKTVLDHLFARAMHSSGLFYRALTTGADGGGDAPASIDSLPADALLSETQAVVMLSLLRANALLLADSTTFAPFASYDFTGKADALFRAMIAAKLWDDAGSGYIEGYVPSTSTFLTNKTTRANALMYAAVHRKFYDAPPRDAGAMSPEVVQLKALRAVMTQEVPQNTSLLTIVVNQNAFLRASTKDYMLLTETRGASYTARDTAAALEAMSEQGYATLM